MKRAYDLISDRLVKAVSFRGEHSEFLCPHCCVGVHLRKGKKVVTHFAHDPGEASPLCEDYKPSAGTSRPTYAPAHEFFPLFLHLHADSKEWKLALEPAPLGVADRLQYGPSALAGRVIKVMNERGLVGSVDAGSLMDISDTSSIEITPHGLRMKVTTSGRWGADADRWHRVISGIPATGRIFAPFRGGRSFKEYEWGTPVSWGVQVVLEPPRVCRRLSNL